MRETRARVLAIDDDALVRRVLELVLRRGPWETVVVDSGEAGLERLAAEPFDVVISDLRMPVVSGIDVARWVAEHRPETKVVIVTGFATPADEKDIAALGATLLRKPFEGPALLEVVTRLLAR